MEATKGVAKLARVSGRSHWVGGHHYIDALLFIGRQCHFLARDCYSSYLGSAQAAAWLLRADRAGASVLLPKPVMGHSTRSCGLAWKPTAGAATRPTGHSWS